MGWSRNAKGLDGMEFVKCVQESFLTQCMADPTGEEATWDFLLGNETGDVAEVTLEEHSDHNLINFPAAVEKGGTAHKGEGSQLGQGRFWRREREETPIGKWEAFKMRNRESRGSMILFG